jgi:hypothetical protein
VESIDEKKKKKNTSMSLEEQGKKKGTGAGKTRREPMDPTSAKME